MYSAQAIATCGILQQIGDYIDKSFFANVTSVRRMDSITLDAINIALSWQIHHSIYISNNINSLNFWLFPTNLDLKLAQNLIRTSDNNVQKLRGTNRENSPLKMFPFCKKILKLHHQYLSQCHEVVFPVFFCLWKRLQNISFMLMLENIIAQILMLLMLWWKHHFSEICHFFFYKCMKISHLHVCCALVMVSIMYGGKLNEKA